MAEDIISTLPDPILCHILSFLETKESVATSILSKRWKYLWLSVTTLYFTNTMGADENTLFRFNDSVYSVLLSRDPALSIKTFRLEVVYNFNPHNRSSHSVFKWVNFVLQRGVEYLHLDVSIVTWSQLCLPINILNCRTLVVLKLSGFIVQVGFSSVVLPSLKTLHLENIWFSKVRDYMLIIRGCPILEDLFASDLSVHSYESLTSEEWKSFCLSNLTRADIDYTCCRFLLKAVQYVQSLRLVIIDDEQVDNCIDSIPTFHNLTQLVLLFFFDWYYLRRGWQFLLELLNHCSRLQKFDVDQIVPDEETSDEDDEDYVIVAGNVPHCLSLHLRTCNLLNISLKGKLTLARYILKNARVLQTMTISNRGQPEIKSLLSSCPRASAACKLTFQFQYVRSLRLVIDDEQVRHCIDSIPIFHNLTQLVLASYCDWHSLCRGWQFLVELLNHCPKLQKFDVDQIDPDEETSDEDDEDYVIVADNVPHCLSLHLRTCNLLNISLKGNLTLARYILKNARVLQTMTISNRGQPEIKSLLSSCPRASATCKLTFQ